MECAIVLNVRALDLDAFERNMALLKPFYYDLRYAFSSVNTGLSCPLADPALRSSLLPASPRENMVVGLNLLRLIAQNQIAAFHSALELVSPELMLSDPFIRYPVAMEQWFMEGAYNKIFKNRDALPAPEYGVLLDTLVTTARHAIASCSERAYSSLSMADAAKLLNIASEQELLLFIQEVRTLRLSN